MMTSLLLVDGDGHARSDPCLRYVIINTSGTNKCDILTKYKQVRKSRKIQFKQIVTMRRYPNAQTSVFINRLNCS